MDDANRDTSGLCKPERMIAADVAGSVAAAAQLMRDNNIGCVVVNDADGKISGIISERDIVNRVVAKSIDPESVTAGQIMTTDIASVRPGTPVGEIQEIMARREVRHMPVVSDGVAVGIVSSRDVMHEQLEAARTGREAAEEIAKLSKSFKTLDFSDLLDVITREVPKIFRAQRAMLYLCGPDGSEGNESDVVRHRCHCTDRDRRGRTDVPNQADDECKILCHDAPGPCEELCGASKAVIIPLKVRTFRGSSVNKEACQYGYLCSCGVDPAVAVSQDLLFYEGTLVREILCGVLSNARMYKDARDSYLIDPLTGAGTRRMFDEKLSVECIRAARYDRPFCLAIVDLDHFKTINDELGHDVGDQVLKALGQTLTREKRQTDVLARYGGDEFVLLMPETPVEAAVTVMERMRGSVGEISLPAGHVVSLSCGVAEQMSDQQESGGDLFRRADLALFEAKRAGRNCTRSWRNVSERLGLDDFLGSETVLDIQQQVIDFSASSRNMFAESIWGLVRAIEARDPFTSSHSVHVMHYAVAIGTVMELGEEDIEVIRRAGMIHDIGMIGVPDDILRSCRPLTDEERAKVEKHPRIGAHILQRMRSLELEIPIVRHHHERWDGQGYPNGISGTRIPPFARILSVADAFDAITSNRSHRRSRTVAQAIDIITDGVKKQFDAVPVRALVRWVDQMGENSGKGRDIAVEDLLESLHVESAMA